jgi:type IV secretion system protein VirD4
VSGQQVRPVNDQLLNLGLGALGGGVAFALILRGAGTATAWLSGLPAPTGGAGSGLGVFAHPLDPGTPLGVHGLNWMLYWTLVTVMLAIIMVPTVWVVAKVRAHRSQADPRKLEGTATPAEIRRLASAVQLVKLAATIRPSVARPTAQDVGYLLGTARGQQVWATVEDSILLIGPPRSGKGLHIVINAILDAPGAVISTSTRPDNLTATLTARQRLGPVAVFDPQQLAPGLPVGLRWSPVRGCQDPLTAMIRATGLAAGTGLGGNQVENGSFWEGKTRAAIQSLLHAAALDGRDARTVYQWALSPAAAGDAVRILQTNPGAAYGWADSLDSMIQSDARTRDSIWQGVGLAFQALADPRVLSAVTPGDGKEFDPADFLTRRGTLYLLATGAGAGASAGLVAAFIEDLVETARKLAARSPGARLDPPLLMALDEIGNLAPLPSLPTLMAEGGGTGITTMPVLQSLAQAREKWGDNNANAIWDASIVKIILGGASNSRDLQDLSTLIGDRDEQTSSVSTDQYGGYSSQRSLRRVPVMPPNVLRTLPFGMSVTMLRTARPIITDLRPWTARTDGRQLQDERSNLEDQLRTS